MKKINILLASLILSNHAYAIVRPVISIAAGPDITGFNMNQNVTLIPPFQNQYYANTQVIDFAGGIFLGIETPISNLFSGQIGLSYYENTNYQVQGIIYQFNDPNLDNTKYQYNIQSKKILLDAKLLMNFIDHFHPFFTLGAGQAINNANNYTEFSAQSDSVPLNPGYGDHTSRNFAYFLGAGMEFDITNNTRLGCMYRYTSIGDARLNNTPLQVSTAPLANNSIHINQILFQLSYLG